MAITKDYSLVAACEISTRLIGSDGDMPWSVPEEMKIFRRITRGGAVIMGRKTWESIGAKPLPNRVCIVLTRDRNYVATNGLIAHSFESALQIAFVTGREIFVIGGEEIYRQTIGDAQRVYLSELVFPHGEAPNGDAFFPDVPNMFSVKEYSIHDAEKCVFSHTVYEKAIF